MLKISRLLVSLSPLLLFAFVRAEDTQTNPYQRRGCLALQGTNKHLRTVRRLCNSDDKTGSGSEEDSLDCIKSQFSYPEIRIHHGDWETSILQAWILQIVLMELAQAPATVGLTTDNTAISSFYSPQTDMIFSNATYPYPALAVGNRYDDCRATPLPCAHVFPEVWTGQEPQFSRLVEADSIEPPIGNGQVATGGFYIPRRLAREMPSLQGLFGYQGEANRQLLANLFKRPLTWKQYCDTISVSNCANSDEMATRPPETVQEEAMYFAEQLYTGYFHATDANNCTNNENCTGHIISPPCDWSINTDQRLFWNDVVGLDPELGTNPSEHFYGWNAMIEVWRAANATNSNVIMNRYKPDSFVTEFQNTDYEFHRVTFPVATAECFEHRVTTEEKCDANITVRRGEELGACDTPPQQLLKLISTNVRPDSSLSDPMRSPTYDILRNLRISELDIESIIQRWHATDNRTGLDARDAVCEWVVEHYDALMQEAVPPGYPRRIVDKSEYDEWWARLALVIAIAGGLAAIAACSMVARYRNTKVIVFAQPLFLNLILIGYTFTCVGAATFVFEPTRGICLTSRWFSGLGYNMVFVPIIIKTSAINSLVRSSFKRTARINIRRSVLATKVAVVIGIVVTYYSFWMAYDPLEREDTLFLDRDDPSVVEYHPMCDSEGEVWALIAFVWDMLLLFIAAVLACQTRHLIQEFNESASLGTLVYSNFLFMVLQAIFFFFYFDDEGFSRTVAAVLISLATSLNAIFAMVIYILPKLIQARNNPEPYRRSHAGATSMSKTSYRDGSSGELTILNCTANLGNAEPTEESMKAWIPPLGETKGVKPLEGVEQIRPDYFDVITIGMQESTWKEKERSVSRNITEREKLSKEDILSALEEHHTAKLREMIMNILGGDYVQIAEELRGQMRLYVYALLEVADDIDHVRIEGANTGVGNMMANKGGIVVSMTYKRTRLSFLSAHLAAHEGESYYQARCDSMKTILKESKTYRYDMNSKLDAATSSHHMFVMGDLNFRTKFDDSEESSHEENVQRALDLIAHEDYTVLYGYDELRRGVEKGDFLSDFKTLPCRFPPTFKVMRQEGIEYKTQRVPSYTDRILFKSAPGLSANLTPLAYEPCIDFVTSDHKPIRGAFAVAANETIGGKQVEGDLEISFRNMSCSNLVASNVSIRATDPYLMFVWDGIELEHEGASLLDKLWTLLGSKAWPRTRFISRTLNPDWGSDTIKLSASSPIVGTDAMLFVIAMDFDAGPTPNSFLGAVSLNVKDLVTMGPRETTKELSFDMPLQRHGVAAGTIQFSLDVKAGSPRHRRFTLNPFFRSSEIMSATA